MVTAITPPIRGVIGGGEMFRPTGKVLPEHARAHNRSLVLRRLFHAGPTSRADLARATGLTRVTVSDLVAELLAEGLAQELGVRAESRVGKPATIVALRPDAYEIIAVDLADDSRIRGAVVNLLGAIRVRRSVPLHGAVGEDARRLVAAFCADLLAEAVKPVLGVGIGSPGIVDPTGTVVEAPNLGWYGLPLARQLTEELGVPTLVANDANTAALGEFTFGGADGGGFLLLTVGHGVGAGIMLDGVLVRGNHNAAGEIGHVMVDERGAPCACGRRGCLETVLAVPALRRAIAGRGPRQVGTALASAGRRLGTALAPVVSALNLRQVMLSGPPELLDGRLKEAALHTIRRRSIQVVGDDLELRMTSLGEDVALAGATVLVLSGRLGVA